MVSRPLLVLFVSTGNAARSQMAEAILNAKKSDAFRARSAGMSPLGNLPVETKTALELAGLDPQKHHPKRWEDFFAAQSIVPVDVIITLSEEAREGLPQDWPGNPVRVHWTLDDPLAADRPDVQEWKYRKCLSVLESRIQNLLRVRPAVSQAELLLRLKDIGMVV